MVRVKDPNSLEAELYISDVGYDPSQSSSKITITLRISYLKSNHHYDNFEKIIKPNNEVINKLKTKVEENNKSVNEKLEKIKERIKALLILEDEVNVNLYHVALELLPLAKREIVAD